MVKYDRATVLQVMDSCLNTNELREFCFLVGLDFENLPGDNKRSKCVELMLFYERSDCIANLVEDLIDYRADFDSKFPLDIGVADDNNESQNEGTAAKVDHPGRRERRNDDGGATFIALLLFFASSCSFF